MNIAILGTGLIGASLGLALRRTGLATTIVGFDRSRAHADRARRIGAIDRVARSPAAAARGADVVVIAVPVFAIVKTARAARPARGAIVTDVGSVKAPIVAALDAPNFVGAHPLAGSDHSGPDAASATLFRGRTCVVTRGAKTSARAGRAVSRLWSSVGARVVHAGAETHDRLMALSSHVPHLVAFGLALQAQPLARAWVAPSLREMTRVAGSDPALWREILLANRAVPEML
ncbi:MAG: prephenate dehydrogenase/arogenate dehydrogenase family protein, partial [Myxococcota bacterium]